MDSKVDLYLKRAEDELLLAKINFNLSTKPEVKEFMRITLDKTFFNDVISESYYSIFYATKAYLLTKYIETFPPEEHKKTYEEFRKFVNSGELKQELLEIYETEAIKAESLLSILFREKWKRGKFIYNVKSEANIPFAQESIDNAKKFISSIKLIIETRK